MFMIRVLKTWFYLCMLVAASSQPIHAQQFVVNMAGLEGLDITPDNMWGFQIQSFANVNTNCRINGTIQFRNADYSIRFNFPYTLKPGVNTIDASMVNPQWNYSSTALRELFTYHKVLPQGTYQYCISVVPVSPGGEYTGSGQTDDCLYKQAKDLFSITLLEPENNAKIYEYNPMLTWIATYPFAQELTYKIRIAEIKKGQTTESAIARNNPVYSENNLTANSIVYPVYGKPLQVWQPYAWTVDAYYKGVLLGGAQPWKFTIVEDSLHKILPDESSYVDINIDKGSNTYYAVGQVKFRYEEQDFLNNELTVSIVRKGSEKHEPKFIWSVQRGGNFNAFDLTNTNLKHNEEFEVLIEYKSSRTNNSNQKVKYKYVNPSYVK